MAALGRHSFLVIYVFRIETEQAISGITASFVDRITRARFEAAESG